MRWGGERKIEKGRGKREKLCSVFHIYVVEEPIDMLIIRDFCN